MKKVFLFFPVLSLLFLGVGCMATSQTAAPVKTSEVNQGTAPLDQTAGQESTTEMTCPSGTTLYLDETIGFQFCYPLTATAEKYHGEYFVKDANGEVLKDLAVYNYDTPTVVEFLTDNFVNSQAEELGYTCEVGATIGKNGTTYMVSGYLAGDPNSQGLDSVAVCRDTSRYETALTNLPAEFFFAPTTANEYFVVISGGQEPTFGEYETAFSDSISFR